MVSASDPTQPQPVTIPLTQLQRGRKGRIALADDASPDSAMLRAMGLKPQAEVRICRLGQPCIVAVKNQCGGGCRIGHDRSIADRVKVCPAD